MAGQYVDFSASHRLEGHEPVSPDLALSNATSRIGSPMPTTKRITLGWSN
jgi:hypothetical protein